VTDRAGNAPARRQRVRRFYAWQAPFYDNTRRLTLPGRQRAIDALGVGPGDTTIDFACGTGLNVPGLRRAGAGRILGVDLSDAMLQRAAKRFPDVEFRSGDLTTIDLGVRVPRILCTWGLSLVESPAAALRNLERHLLPGGRLVLLDFDRLQGPFRPIQPLFWAWLAAFGVRAPWDQLGPGWTAPFATWGRESIGAGYGALAWAQKAEKRTSETGLS
jgi:ubiquinone/menaquinone biosynthesis C-methylase UbiE